jgi:hypothetical protein
MEYSTTGIAGGYVLVNAPEFTHQMVQPLGGNYCDLVAYHVVVVNSAYQPCTTHGQQAGRLNKSSVKSGYEC